MILSKQHKNDAQISLNHPIEIWDMHAIGVDETGAETEAPVWLADDWALVVPNRGVEYTETDRTMAETQYKVTIRWRSDINQTMSIVWEDRVLHIVAILDLQGRHMYQEIIATEDYKATELYRRQADAGEP